MAKFPIDLGKSYGEAMPMTRAPSNSKPNDHYPTLHLDEVEDLELPDEGTITLRYKLCRDTTCIDKEGDKTKSFALDIKEVVGVKAAPVQDSDTEDASDALDKLREETEGEAE